MLDMYFIFSIKTGCYKWNSSFLFLKYFSNDFTLVLKLSIKTF